MHVALQAHRTKNHGSGTTAYNFGFRKKRAMHSCPGGINMIQCWLNLQRYIWAWTSTLVPTPDGITGNRHSLSGHLSALKSQCSQPATSNWIITVHYRDIGALVPIPHLDTLGRQLQLPAVRPSWIWTCLDDRCLLTLFNDCPLLLDSL